MPQHWCPPSLNWVLIFLVYRSVFLFQPFNSELGCCSFSNLHVRSLSIVLSPVHSQSALDLTIFKGLRFPGENEKKKNWKSAKLNRATTAVLCNLSQYLPISRDNVDDFMLCHTILALYTCTCPCFWKDLPHSATISLRTAPAIHRCCSWQKCTLLRSKIINTFGAVSQRRMRGESTNHQKS